MSEESCRSVPGTGGFSGGRPTAQHLGDGLRLFEDGDSCSGAQVDGEVVVDRADFAFELRSLREHCGGVAFDVVGVGDLAFERDDFDGGVGDVVRQRPD